MVSVSKGHALRALAAPKGRLRGPGRPLRGRRGAARVQTPLRAGLGAEGALPFLIDYR